MDPKANIAAALQSFSVSKAKEVHSHCPLRLLTS